VREPAAVTSTDDERWVEANSILGRYTTPSAAARQRRRRRTIWLIILGTALVGGVAGGVAGALVGSGGHAAHTNEPSTWQYVLGFALSGIGLVGGVVSVVSLIRAGQWGAAWRSPTTVLTRQQRKQLLREVRGQEPLDPTHLALARDLARRLVIQRRQALLWASLVLLWLGQAIVFPDLLHLILFGGVVLLWAIAIPQMLRQSNRAQRFLDRHDAHFPEDPADGNRGVA
jgi:MFS family permease